MIGLNSLRRSPLARRVGATLVFLAALLLVPLPASGGVLWDIGMAIGYACLGAALTLYLFPLRAEGLPHRRLYTLTQHKRLGWTILALGVLHAGVLLIAQPKVGHYLLPSAPFYMLAGLAALILLGVLIATGLSARKTHRKHPTQPTTEPVSVSTHAILGSLLMALIALHLIGSAQLLDIRAKAVTACVLLAIPLVWTAYRRAKRRQPGSAGTRAGAANGASSGKRPTGSAAGPQLATAMSLLVLCVAPIPTAAPQLRKQPTEPDVMPISFPHEKHTSVNCVTCHHNFSDNTGPGNCLECHRTDPKVPHSPEVTFHTFCRDCHTTLAHTTAQHGPTRGCSDCHNTSREGIGWTGP